MYTSYEVHIEDLPIFFWVKKGEDELNAHFVKTVAKKKMFNSKKQEGIQNVNLNILIDVHCSLPR